MKNCVLRFIAFTGVQESRSLGLERKKGGKLLLRLNIDQRPIAKKYIDGKVKRTPKKGVKSA